MAGAGGLAPEGPLKGSATLERIDYIHLQGIRERDRGRTHTTQRRQDQKREEKVREVEKRRSEKGREREEKRREEAETRRCRRIST